MPDRAASPACFIIRNLEKFQHYKHRRPPWIKWHREVLDNAEIMGLPDAALAIVPCLLLIASERDEPGCIPFDADWLSWRFRRRVKHSTLEKLLIAGFIAPCLQHASKCLQVCTNATQRQSRDRVETETEAASAKRLQHGADHGFPEWWAALRPWFKAANRRLGYKSESLEYWKAHGLAEYAELILERTVQQRTHYQDAVRSNERPVPPQDPIRYLKNRRYNDETP